MLRRSFRAMGTDVELFLVDDCAAALDAAESEFHRLEALFSRFRPDSELSLLNRRGRFEASDDLLEVVELALAARARTSGRFDPTVHDALVAAGYDRTFEALGPTARRLGSSTAAVVAASRSRTERSSSSSASTSISAASARAMRSTGLWRCWPRLPGARERRRGHRHARPAGSLRLARRSREPDAALDGGAVATSGRDRRRWRRDGEERPHEALPYFWSDQFELRLQYVGHAEEWAAVDLDGDPDSFVARYIAADGSAEAALAVNRPAEVGRLRGELTEVALDRGRALAA
jgi:thiamine biosynthesis lipoprotein